MTKPNPQKKTDYDLFQLLSEKIDQGGYFFVNHAKQRILERGLLEIEILDILNGRDGKKRKRNKRKEKYCAGYPDWNYCVEGIGADRNKIRIVFSFSEEFLIIITAIQLI